MFQLRTKLINIDERINQETIDCNKCFFEQIHSSNLIKLRHIFDKHTLWKCHEPVSYTNDTRLLNIRKHKLNVRICLQMNINNSPIKLMKMNQFVIYLYISHYERSTNQNDIWHVLYIHIHINVPKTIP